MQIDNFPKHIFWSYKKGANLPESIIIKQVALYGEIDDIKNLTKLINKEKIVEVLNTIKSNNEKRVNFIIKVIL